MPSETVLAVFDTTLGAEAAIVGLIRAGVPWNAIERYSNQQFGLGRPQGEQPDFSALGQFWSWLTENESDGIEPGDGSAYGRAIEDGKIIVTVVTDAARTEQVASLLEHREPSEFAQGAAGSRMTGGGTNQGGRVRRYRVERTVEEQIRMRDDQVAAFRRLSIAATAVPGADEDPLLRTAAQTLDEVRIPKRADQQPASDPQSGQDSTASFDEDTDVTSGVTRRGSTVRR